MHLRHEDDSLVMRNVVSGCINHINGSLQAIFSAYHCTEETATEEHGYDEDDSENDERSSIFRVKFFLRLFVHCFVVFLFFQSVEVFLFLVPFPEATKGCHKETNLNEYDAAPGELLCEHAHKVDVNDGPNECTTHANIHGR